MLNYLPTPCAIWPNPQNRCGHGHEWQVDNQRAHRAPSGDRGAAVRLGGNIGHAVLDLDMPAQGAQTVYVLELSSYQIDLLETLAPDVAVLTNLSPDHLDRHGDMAGYVAAKSRLFDMLAPCATAVIGCDDDESRAIADALGAESRQISRIATSGDADICWRDGTLMTGKDILADLNNAPALRGAHNGQNAAAATAVLGALGYGTKHLQQALESFPGLAHRLQPVGAFENLIFVNDSKATNAGAHNTRWPRMKISIGLWRTRKRRWPVGAGCVLQKCACSVFDW